MLKTNQTEKGETKGTIEYEIKNKEYINKLNELKESLSKSISPRGKYYYFSFIIPIIIAFIATMLIMSMDKNENLIDKEKITSKIKLAIKNNAGLTVVKQIYKNRQVEQFNISRLIISKDKNYPKDVLLVDILKDIEISLYQNSNKENDSLKVLLGHIIGEHIKIHPFDKLENYQKDMFDNFSFKIPESYHNIHPDLVKISDELYNKNLLVTKYLDKSNTSFIISITALIISLIIGGYQIFQNRESKLKNLLEANILSDIAEKKSKKD